MTIHFINQGEEAWQNAQAFMRDEIIRQNAQKQGLDSEAAIEEAEDIEGALASTGLKTTADQIADFDTAYQKYSALDMWAGVDRQDDPFGAEYTIREVTGMPRTIDGTLGDPKFLEKQGRKLTYERAKMTRSTFGIGQRLARWAHRNDEVLSPQEAHEYSRSLGGEYRPGRPVTAFQVEQYVETTQRQRMLEESLALVEASIPSRSVGQNFMLGASALAGAISPTELFMSIGATALLPGAAISVAKAGATALQSSLRTKKAIDAILTSRNVATKLRMLQASSSGAGAARSHQLASTLFTKMPELETVEEAAQLFVKSGKASEISKEIANYQKLSAQLEKIAGLSPESMTALEKNIIDGTVFTAVDAQFIQNNRLNSKELGVDLYTEKDRDMDLLFAGFMGVGVPTTVRFVGEKFLGKSPTALKIRRLESVEKDIKVKESLGKISKERANASYELIDKMKETYGKVGSNYKNTHPYFKKAVEDLQAANTTSETLHAQKKFVFQEILNSNVPKISMIPSFESLMSQVHADTIGRLMYETPSEVFGANLVKSVSRNGVHTLEVMGETGLLGRKQIAALTAADAEKAMHDMYKGFILRDEQAAKDFSRFSVRQWYFWDDLTKIEQKYREQMQANVAAGEGNPVYSGKALINIKTEIGNAYLRARLGNEGTTTLLQKLKNNNVKKALGKEQGELTAEELAVLKDRDNFLDQFILAKKLDKKEVYDFKNPRGKKDGGIYFRQYLKELEQGVDGNVELACTDDFLVEYTYNADALKNAQDAILKNDISADTNLNQLFGDQRRTFEELRQMNQDNKAWNGERSLRALDFRALRADEKLNKQYNQLYRVTSMDKEVPGVFAIQADAIQFLERMHTEGHPGIKEALTTSIFEDTQLQGLVTTAATSGEGVTRAIELRLKELIAKSLRGKGYSKYISDMPALTHEAMTLFKQGVEKNPEALDALLNPEAKKALQEIRGEDITPDDLAVRSEVLGGLIDPIMLGIDTACSRIQLEAINNISINTKRLGIMLDHPDIAAEVPSGAATQTIYAFEGAASGVEYMKGQYGLYLNDLKNQIRKEDPHLLDFFENPENYDLIREARIRAKYGEDIQDNTDAARIASMWDSNEATIASSLRRYGSTFEAPTADVKADQIQHAATAFTDEEISDIITKANEGLGTKPSLSVLANVTDEAQTKNVKEALGKIKHSLEIFDRINREDYRKLCLAVFRDCDLDAMFDRNMSRPQSLNAVRDAALAGKWEEFMGEDPQKIIQAGNDMEFLTKKLFGEQVQLKRGGYEVQGDSWVYKFKQSADDLAAAISGKKSWAVNKLNNRILFKDADSEIKWSRLFGSGSAQEALEREYTKLFHAKYSLENFGSRPMELTEELVDTYNYMVKHDPDTLQKLKQINELKGDSQGVFSKYVITPGAKRSILAQVSLANGLQNESPSTASRLIRVLMTFGTSGLLAKAAAKSFADFGTIGEGLLLNGYAEGRLEAAATMARAAKMAAGDRDLVRLMVASNVLHAEEVARIASNNPGLSLTYLSKSADTLEKVEHIANKWGNFMLNDVGRMSQITNFNKTSAALSIQYSIGKNAGTPFEQLNQDLQLALFREGLDADDWNFIRTHSVGTINDYVKDFGKTFNDGDDPWFIPQKLMDVPDEVWAKELERRGHLNITQGEIDYFKMNITGKAWNIVDAASSQMVSLPSGRVLNMLRGGAPKNSGAAIAWELITQYQTFGVASVYNTFGRKLANAAARETGVSIIDLFNPNVQLQNQNRIKLWGSMLGSLMALTSATFCVNTAVNALSGRVQRPFDDQGNFHGESIFDALWGSMGVFGVFSDATINAVTGSGIRGGGFSIQVAPAIANPARTLYRFNRIAQSKTIADKGAAAYAEFINSLARFTGVKNAPIMAPIFQMLYGAYLDQQVAGGPTNNRRRLKMLEDRGYMTMPWDEDPRPFWDRLQD